MIGHGCVIAIGGNEEKRATRASILAAFVRRAGAQNARIVIIPSASIEPVKRAERYTKIFTRLGAGEVIAVHAERGITDAEREAVRNATGIFVTGGDQGRLMEALRASDCVAAIRESVRNGAVYAGTSAGASAASGRMIAGSIKQKKGVEVVEIAEGLGLIPDVIIDQHFAERRRLPRLIHAASEQQLTGVGIDENTAIIWSRNGVMTVEGTGAVTIVDPDRQLDSAARSYRLHVLSDGAEFVQD